MDGPYSAPSENDRYIHPMIKVNSLSVTCLMLKNQLVETADNYQCRPEVNTLKKQVNQKYSEDNPIELIGNEGFHQDPALGFNTAFLIDKDLVATVAHAVCDDNGQFKRDLLQTMYLVFGFQKGEANACRRVFPKKDVYKVIDLVSSKFSREYNGADWAILKLDRSVEDRAPLPIETSEVAPNTEVYMLGHPLGTSLKLARNAQIKIVRPMVLDININAFTGSGGSPIFNSSTHKVIGIVVSGRGGFKIDKAHQEKTGQKRVIVHKVQQQEIFEQGNEKCQRISDIDDFKKYN